MHFSLLDLEMNSTCDDMNFTHLAWLMLLHYLVKFETPKMRVNTNSVFDVTGNYKIAVNAPNYINSFTKCSDEAYNTTKQ